MVKKLICSFGIQDLLIIVTSLTLFVFGVAEFAADPGIGWHLKTGEYIINSHSIPYSDPFLALSTGDLIRPWIADQWMSDAILFLCYFFGSWQLIYFVCASLFIYAFSYISYHTALSNCGSPVSSSLAILTILILAQIHFILRPVVFSYLFLSILIFYIQQKLSTRTKATFQEVLLLFVFFILWANLHPAFILGIFLLLIATVASACSNSFVIFSLASIIGSFCTPYRAALYRQIFSLTSSHYFMNLHDEWKNPAINSLIGGTIITIGVIIFIGTIFQLRTKLNRSSFIFQILSSTIFFILALKSLRMAPIFGLIIAPALANTLSVLSSKIMNFSPALINAGSRIEKREMLTSRGSIGFLLSLLAIALVLIFSKSLRLELGPPSTQYPSRALEALTNACPTSQCTVLANPNWGGFITFNGFPKLRALIDDRNNLLGEAFYQEYFSATKSKEELMAFAQKLNADYLLVASGKNSTDKDYGIPIFQDDVATAYSVSRK